MEQLNKNNTFFQAEIKIFSFDILLPTVRNWNRLNSKYEHMKCIIMFNENVFFFFITIKLAKQEQKKILIQCENLLIMLPGTFFKNTLCFFSKLYSK